MLVSTLKARAKGWRFLISVLDISWVTGPWKGTEDGAVVRHPAGGEACGAGEGVGGWGVVLGWRKEGGGGTLVRR